MSALGSLLARPAADEAPRAWFARIADALLRRTILEIAGEAHELCEVEFYLHGVDHPDPFTHNQEIQRGSGRWYFHRSGPSYRGGSFKGVDLCFGPPEVFGGILIRSLVTADGELICGSSLCVDHLLARTGHGDVASLAAAVAEHDIEAPASPLRLRPTAARERTIWSTARVGLTLKRAAEHPTMLDYIARPYRALTRPRAITKGRVYTIVAMHQAGLDADAIARATGSPKPTIRAYLDAYARGQALASSGSLVGRSLGSIDLCVLLGALAAADPSA